MRARLTSILAVLGAVTVLVLAANTVALAATGRGFLLGQTNQSAKLTTLERITTGPALRLQTKNESAPPFSTNATGTVRNLDADTVDGLDASDLSDPDRLHGVPYNEVINRRLEADLQSDVPALVFERTVPSSNYASLWITYNVTLTGGSGRSVCAIVTNNPSGDYPPPYPGTTTGAGASPSITGFASISAPEQPFGVRLRCTSESPFTVTGHVSTSVQSYFDECALKPNPCD